MVQFKITWKDGKYSKSMIFDSWYDPIQKILSLGYTQVDVEVVKEKAEKGD